MLRSATVHPLAIRRVLLNGGMDDTQTEAPRTTAPLSGLIYFGGAAVALGLVLTATVVPPMLWPLLATLGAISLATGLVLRAVRG